MNCCEKTTFEELASDAIEGGVGRRTLLKGLAGAAGGAAVLTSPLARAALEKIRLAFCGQLLCVVPYEVARARGHFAAEGLDVELVYTRGGNQAMQALVGGAVEYAGTSFDVALQAYARGGKVKRFASTGRLPLFALATAPKTADAIRSVKDLENRTVGISGLGNADQTILLYLLKKAGADSAKVRFATIGTNLYDALRLGQVDAGMVQEPALSLLTAAGGRSIVNAMDLADAEKFLGGAYEFMGTSVRADEFDRRREQMKRLARALAKGLIDSRTIPPEEVVASLPKELVAGGDRPQLIAMLERYRRDLFPDNVKIDRQAVDRVIEAHRVAALVEPGVDFEGLLDFSIVEP